MLDFFSIQISPAEATVIAAILTVVATLVAAIVSVVTSFILNLILKFNDKKEEQRDETAKRIESLILEISDLACDYWSIPGSHQNADRIGHSINGRFPFLVRLFENLFADHINEDKIVSEEIRNFHRSCTGEDFLVKSRQAQIERTEEIVLLAFNLIDVCYIQRKKLSRGRIREYLIIFMNYIKKFIFKNIYTILLFILYILIIILITD